MKYFAKIIYSPNEWNPSSDDLLFSLQESLSHSEFNKLLSDYYVLCSVSGEKISLIDLHYWSVEDQCPFKSYKEALTWHQKKKY